MDKLGYALVLSLVAMGFATTLVRAQRDALEPGAAAKPAAPRLGALALSLFVGVVVFRLAGRPELGEARTRIAACLSGLSFGAAAALACGLLRARLVARRDAPQTDAIRVGAASSVVPLLASAIGAGVLTMVVARGGVAALDALPRVLSAFALGVGIVVLVGEGGGAAVLVAAACGAGATIAASSVAVRASQALVAAGIDPLALPALPLALQAQAALCTLVGAMATRVDPDEPPDAPRVRGLAVVVVTAALAAASGAHWWFGHGGFLALSAFVGALAAWLALLVGRYYDDPEHRPRRTLSRARPAARAWAGTVVGAEGGAALVAVASLAIVGAHRAAASIPGIHAGAGMLGVVVAAAVVSAAAAYLDALAIVDVGGVEARAQTLAHDVVSVTIAAYLVLATVHAPISGREILVGAIVGALVVGGYVAVGLRGAPRAAALVLVVRALFAGVAAGPGRAALITAAGAVGAMAQLAAIVLERTATAHVGPAVGDAGPIDGSIQRLRALAGACPALAAAFALAAATVVASFGG